MNARLKHDYKNEKNLFKCMYRIHIRIYTFALIERFDARCNIQPKCVYRNTLS